ncbi:MAG TPA: hypothetical protein VIK08_08025 [Candidatus Limnocylindrales bacterium]
MPQVQVTQDPLAVVLIVGLIAAAAIVALLVAGPWSARVPSLPSVDAHEPSEPVSSPTVEPVAPITTPPPVPTDIPPEPAWASTRHKPLGHD